MCPLGNKAETSLRAFETQVFCLMITDILTLNNHQTKYSTMHKTIQESTLNFSKPVFQKLAYTRKLRHLFFIQALPEHGRKKYDVNDKKRALCRMQVRNSTSACTSGSILIHYENTPIQIYRKFHLLKTENFQTKNFDIFHISAQNIDCGYSLEPPRRGGSNEYTQSMFLSRN